MGDPNQLRPRAPLESSADEVPTQILSQRPGEEYGDDDGNTIEHREEPTIRADVETEELRAKAPPSLRALGVAPAMQPKPPRPAAKVEPLFDEIEPMEGDSTEVGAIPRLVAVAAPAEREEHTAIMAAPPPKPATLGTSMPTPPMAMAPVPIPPPPPSSSPAAGSPSPEDDPPYEVPGLDARGRGKWIGGAALLLVLVGVGGIAVGRLSAKGVAPAASSATAMVTAALSQEPTGTRETIPPPAPVEEEPAKPPAPAPAAAPATAPLAPAPRPHVAPHPAPRPRSAPPSGVIVRDAPF